MKKIIRKFKLNTDTDINFKISNHNEIGCVLPCKA